MVLSPAVLMATRNARMQRGSRVGGVSAFDPSDVADLLVSLDPTSLVELGGAVAQWSDLSGNANHAIQPDAAFRVDYEANNALIGGPAAVWSSSETGFNLTTGIVVKYAVFSLAYYDGVDATFNGHSRLLGTNRYKGAKFTPSMTGDFDVSVLDGVDVGNVVLPMPNNVLACENSLGTGFGVTGIGYDIAGVYRQGWTGPIRKVLLYGTIPTAAEKASILTYMQE